MVSFFFIVSTFITDWCSKYVAYLMKILPLVLKIGITKVFWQSFLLTWDLASDYLSVQHYQWLILINENWDATYNLYLLSYCCINKDHNFAFKQTWFLHSIIKLAISKTLTRIKGNNVKHLAQCLTSIFDSIINIVNCQHLFFCQVEYTFWIAFFSLW